MDGHGTKRREKVAENFNRLSRAHECYREQTDDRRTDGRQHNSEREREFTLAKSRKQAQRLRVGKRWPQCVLFISLLILLSLQMPKLLMRRRHWMMVLRERCRQPRSLLDIVYSSLRHSVWTTLCCFAKLLWLINNVALISWCYLQPYAFSRCHYRTHHACISNYCVVQNPTVIYSSVDINLCLSY